MTGPKIAVLLPGREGRPVGELRYGTDAARRFGLFRYAPSWLGSEDAFALAPDMPLEDRDFRCSGRSALPGPVLDGAPDSWGRGIMRTALPGQTGELDYLLAAGDATRQGALGYATGDETPPAASPCRSRRGLRALRDLVAAWERDRDPSAAEALAPAIGSLGGSRPKADFVDGGHLAIAKFTSVHDRSPVARLEVATLKLARRAGLDAARARLALRQDSRPVAIVRRFDRQGGARLPYLSSRSFLGVRAPGACYTDIAERIAGHGFEPARQMKELYRRLLFTILVSNRDDHLQNHGFLHVRGGLWALAPAFDIVPQPHRRRRLKTAIAPGYSRAASIEAALETAPCFGLGRDDARAMLRTVLEVVTGQWAALCRAEGMTAHDIAACRHAFEHEETERARRLTAPARSAGKP